ncbi:MAG: sigma-70 family RNA polymerase sigma factor [Gemmatimonadaceae bacterium]|nr:sigma-70 family RNA polymerase sigma factor [Gemmatimonadaceae bacterium]MCW5825672.1 sigma-70 family RNA polymerase sigma factor [Gemmatimonadaceae bacterium]
MDDLTDAELVAETRRGNQRAFAALLRRYQDRHARFAARMLGDADDADDVLQSVFVRAFRHIGDCEDPSRFGAWLHRIVVNECRTFAARRGQRELRFVREPLTLDGLEAPGAEGDPALRARIGAAVAELPVEMREAFLLKHVEELEYEEMAELTGAGVSALKMRVKRAIERLREQLAEVAYV